jgi:hypothetical protein
MRDLTAHLRHLFVVQMLGDAPESSSVTAEHHVGVDLRGTIVRASARLPYGRAAVPRAQGKPLAGGRRVEDDQR